MGMDSNRDLKNQVEKLRRASQHFQQSSLTVKQSCLEPEEPHKEIQRFEEPLQELTKPLSGLRCENACEDVAETAITDACTALLETEPTYHTMNEPSVCPEVTAELTLKEASLDWMTVTAELAKVQSDTVESLHKDAEDICKNRSGSLEPETEPVSNA